MTSFSVRGAAVAFVSILGGSTDLDGQAVQPPGKYDVGFERVWEIDHSRVWPRSAFVDSLQGPIARPMRVDVWYPARCRSPERMQHRRYLETEAPDQRFEDLVAVTRAWDEYSYRGLAGDSASFDRLMLMETGVCAAATAEPGPFPLVLYSAGWFNRTPDNTVLAEHLASLGYVVAGVPQLNPGLWTYDFRSDPIAVEQQIRDLEFALGHLAMEPQVDRRTVVAMGYSTGGDVALLLQARNPMIDAVVGLDASFTLGNENNVAGSDFFRPAHHNVPVLALRRPVDDRAAANTVIESLTQAPRWLVEIPGSDHGTFSDDTPGRRFLGAGTKQQEDLHRTVLDVVERFLESVIGSSEWDGDTLNREYVRSGLDAEFLEPVPEAEEPGSQGPSSPAG